MDSFKNRHLVVNWADGMLINSQHFNQLEDSIFERIAQPAALYVDQNRYGLMPNAQGHQEFELDWDDTINTLHLKHCRAVTPGGSLIDVFPELEIQIKPDLKKMEQEPDSSGFWAIFIHIQPHNRDELGVPDSVETGKTGISRPPYTVPNYMLELKPKGTKKAASGPHQLLIGMFKLEGSQLRLLPPKEFVPPCVSIRSDEYLSEIHSNLYKKLSQIRLDALMTVQKIYQKKIRSADQSVAIPLKTISTEMAKYLAGNLGEFRLLIPNRPPVSLVNYVVHLALFMQTTLALLDPNHKQRILNFFEQWTGLSPADFVDDIRKISGLTYKHEDIISSVIDLEGFLFKMYSLFNKMKDLEPVWEEKKKIVEDSTLVEDEPDEEPDLGIKIL